MPSFSEKNELDKEAIQEEDEEDNAEIEDITSNLPFSSPTFAVHSPDNDEERLADLEDAFVPLVHLPPPPDGGWGWVVCFASFMCNLILDGLAYTFGILLEPLVLAFNSNKSTISWVGSILAGVYLMSGPIVGGLVNKYGCRPVCAAGSILAFIGMGVSIFSPNVPVLMLTYGFIGGFGLGLIYLPAVVAVGYYFETKRALATGISVCGSGVGTFLFAPLATYLVGEYGWKGANLIFAGLCLNCIVFGLLMRPLELTLKKHDPEQDFSVLLPDGTHHKNCPTSGENTPARMTPNTSFNHSEFMGSTMGHSTINFSQHLPTITENTITKEDTGERKNVKDIFPQEAEEKADVEMQLSQMPMRPTGRRKRTISENINKSHVTPIRSPKKEMSIPRNSTAPNFVDPNVVLSRNSSAIGFGGLAKMSSQYASHDYKHFGIHCSDLTSNTTLHLEPHPIGRRSSVKPIVRPLYRKDVFYSGSVMHLLESEQNHSKIISQVPSFANIEEYRNSIISIPKQSRRQSAFSIPRSSIVASHLSLPPALRKTSTVTEALESEGGSPIVSAIKEMLNIHLLKNKLFMLICFSNIFGMLGFYTPFVYLPSMALTKGLELESANFLISLIGISNTIGRVFAGWLSDFKFINSQIVTIVAITCSGICVMVLPMCESYSSYVTVSLLFGLFVAAYISLTSIVLVDLLGLDNLTSAFGLLVLFRGISSMVGPPLAGFIFDSTQSYNVSFFISGTFLIIAALVNLIVEILHRRNLTSKLVMKTEAHGVID